MFVDGAIRGKPSHNGKSLLLCCAQKGQLQHRVTGDSNDPVLFCFKLSGLFTDDPRFGNTKSNQ
jgi:hypothetical protein